MIMRDLRASILMVDDRVENLVALEAVLQPLGHKLVRATSGEDALRQVLRADFAVILLDVQMPGLNGFETAELIKSRARSKYTPIIFLTAISKEEEYVFRGYSTGAVDYVFKPFQPEILRSKVSVLVDLHLKTLKLHRQGELLRQSEIRELELRHRTRLLESEARYALIVSSATDAILTCEEDRVITGFNTAAERNFGVKAAEALGHPIDDFLEMESGRDPLHLIHHRAGEESDGIFPERSCTMEGIGIRQGGIRFPVEFSVSSLVLQHERFHTVILRDISERRRAEVLLRTQNESLENAMDELKCVNEQLAERTLELENAIGARSRFYASMSHELRTPINAILGYSSLLLDSIFGPLNDKQVESIKRTNWAAKHLLDLVGDILDLSKIEAGKVELQLEPVTFPDLIQDLFATVAPLAQEHDVMLSLESSEAERWALVSDPTKIRQIAINLVSNAIKFGEGKPVKVVCSRTKEGDLLLDVVDQGPGIPEDEQQRVFEEFVQLDPSKEAGTGLGLSISRRLATLLGGSLIVTSALGEGSTFTLRIPDRGHAMESEGEASTDAEAGEATTAGARSAS